MRSGWNIATHVAGVDNRSRIHCRQGENKGHAYFECGQAVTGILRRLLNIRPVRTADQAAQATPADQAHRAIGEFTHEGRRGQLNLQPGDRIAPLSGLIQLHITWSNTGTQPLPPVRLFLSWQIPGGAGPVRQAAQDMPALGPGAEIRSSVRLGVPLERTGSIDLATEIEESAGSAWQPLGQRPVLHLEAVEAPPSPDFDFEAAYRAADLAHDWWSIVGPSSREEHEALGRGKLRQLQDLGLGSSSRILDIGCGTGQLAEQLVPLLSAPGRYVGTDIAPEAIAFCTERFAGANARFLRSGWPEIPIEDEEFDFIYLGAVLPHLYPAETRALLSEARRLLAEGGQIVADAFVSATVPGHAGNRSMIQVSEGPLHATFAALGLEWRELGSAAWSADCRRVVYRLASPEPPPQVVQGGHRHAILVLGMHRSGTSVVTRLLAAMGATPPGDPDPAAPDNPDGYWEPSGVVRAMEELLAAVDSAWFDWRPLDAAALAGDALAPQRQRIAAAIRTSFEAAPRIVLKDPRACRAARLFRALLAEEGMAPRAVLVLRRPSAVAASLRSRDQISGTYAGLLWARHMLAAEAATRDMPRLLLDYDALMAQPEEEVARVAAFLPWQVDEPPGRLGNFLRAPPAATARDSAFGPGLDAALGQLHGAFARLARHDDAAAHAAVDAAAERVEACARSLAPALEAEFAHLRASGRHMQPGIAQPPGDALAFATAMERLHARLAGPAAPAPGRPMQGRQSPLRAFLFRNKDIYAGVIPDATAIDLQGWNSDHPILGWCIGTLRPRLIIEVGTWKGRSAIAMAHAMEAQGLDGEILCVDTWLGSPEHWLAEGRRQPWRDSLRLVHGYPQLYATFLNNVVAAGLQHRITPLPLPSDAAFLVLHGRVPPAELIYIDAGHDEESVARDLRLYAQLLAPGGALVMDDYGDHWPGVRRAVDTFARDTGMALQAGGGKALLSRQPGLPAAPGMTHG